MLQVLSNLIFAIKYHFKYVLINLNTVLHELKKISILDLVIERYKLAIKQLNNFLKCLLTTHEKDNFHLL